MFLKILFWVFIVGCVISVVQCIQDHPRSRGEANLGVDVVGLIIQIVLVVFTWFYAFGGWIVR